jgi:hypothetical protein
MEMKEFKSWLPRTRDDYGTIAAIIVLFAVANMIASLGG